MKRLFASLATMALLAGPALANVPSHGHPRAVPTVAQKGGLPAPTLPGDWLFGDCAVGGGDLGSLAPFAAVAIGAATGALARRRAAKK